VRSSATDGQAHQIVIAVSLRARTRLADLIEATSLGLDDAQTFAADLVPPAVLVDGALDALATFTDRLRSPKAVEVRRTGERFADYGDFTAIIGGCDLAGAGTESKGHERRADPAPNKRRRATESSRHHIPLSRSGAVVRAHLDQTY
jgi:hypothetical protein